ncbi:mitochondrial cytochrome-like protein b2 [Xylariaceae sp. FL1272]|nr:mitochondrial cytochrome-like protein b2 [Xylariaceae sp. FL1272]
MQREAGKIISAHEIASRRSATDCWVVINDGVYDITEYLDQHPGGAAILLRQGGTVRSIPSTSSSSVNKRSADRGAKVQTKQQIQDATTEFRKIHGLDVLEYLPKNARIGSIDAEARATLRAALPLTGASSDASPTAGNKAQKVPHIATIVSPVDFEAAARLVLPNDSYTYISGSAHNGSAHRGNLSSWQRITFRPRIFQDISSVKPASTILGFPCAFPLYMSPMGQMGRVHADGEAGAVRALARRGAHGVISTDTTASLEEIAASFADEKAKIAASRKNGEQGVEAQLHFQLYIPADRSLAIQRIRRARATGVYRSLWVTVDTVVLGKRTPDRRLQAEEALATSPELSEHAEKAGFGGLSPISNLQFNLTLTWEDLSWIKKEWGGPVVLKGIGNADDALKAADAGCDGILLSNHGGRQMHDAQNALATLLEIRTYCPQVLARLQVFVDGGCRDGSDVLKAICLGATAVGIGRPFYYALAAYGEEGVGRCADLYADEFITGMRLSGIASLGDARPERVNPSRLLNEIWRPEKAQL